MSQQTTVGSGSASSTLTRVRSAAATSNQSIFEDIRRHRAGGANAPSRDTILAGSGLSDQQLATIVDTWESEGEDRARFALSICRNAS